MAQAKVQVVVNDQQLDKLKGKLVELQKGLKIQYDIDGKPLDVVVDKTLNLQKQARLLRNELGKTTDKETFQLLASKLGDVEDKMKRTKASSTDLFASLSLLPGPVGQFFGQLTGVVGLMKTFTGFSLKDLKFQFGELANDFADIYKNISGADDSIEKLGEQSKTTSSDTSQLGNTLQQTTAQSGALTNAIKQQTSGLKNLDDLTKQYDRTTGIILDRIVNNAAAANNWNKEQTITAQKLFDLQKTTENINFGYSKLNNTLKESTFTVIQNGKEIRALTQAELDLVNSGKQVVFQNGQIIERTNEVGKSMNDAKKSSIDWGAALKGAAVAGAISLAIYVISDLIKRVYEYVTGTKAAEEAARKFSDALKEQNYWISYNANEVKRRGAEKIANMRAEGKSAKEIRDEELNQAIALNQQLFKDAEDAYNKRKKLLDEGRVTEALEAGEDYRKKNEAYLQSVSDLRILRAKNTEEERKEKEELDKKEKDRIKEKNDKDKELLKERLQRNKDAENEIRELKKDSDLLSIKNERQRQEAEIVIQFENERKRINALEIDGEIKARLLEQLEINSQKKLKALREKFAQEDEDERKKINEKLTNLKIAAISDENQKTLAELQQNYDEELKALKKALEDKLITLEQYNQAVLDLNKKSENDIAEVTNNISKDATEKQKNDYEEALRLLQLKNEGLIEGTKSYFDNLREILRISEAQEIDEAKRNGKLKKKTEEEIQAEITAIQQKYSLARQDLRMKELESYLNTAKQIGSTISSFISTQNETNRMNEEQALKEAEGNAQAQDQIKRTYFEKNKKASIAQAYISTFQSAIDAFLSLAKIPVVGPYLGGLAAAAAIFFGEKQIQAIRKQSYDGLEAGGAPVSYGRGMARGGYIDGPRHAQGGVMIEAEGGEAVMTRGAVSMFGPLLSMMNQAGGGTNFNKDMMFTANDAPQSSQQNDQTPVVIKTYVVSNDLTTEQEKQARLKQLSTL